MLTFSTTHPEPPSPFDSNPTALVAVTDEGRQLVCDQLERLGLWSTELPAMLGLVSA